MLSLFLLPIIVVTSAGQQAISSSSLDCFSPPGHHHPVMDLVEGVLEKRLDHWLGIIFGEEYPFLGTETDTYCIQGECVIKGTKLLGNFSGPFQIEVMSCLKKFPCNMVLITQMSSLSQNLGWTKLFREKAGWRGEEGELLMEGLARKVFEAKTFQTRQQ